MPNSPDKWQQARAMALANIADMSDAEDAAITAAAATDSDAPVMTDEEWQKAIPRLRKGGRPRVESPKIHQGLRLSPEVLAYFRATGKGWQTRIDAALKEWIAAR